MTPILLNSDLGIDAAADVQRQLMPCVQQTQPLLLDGSQVQRLHTAGLQLLCALFCSRRHAGLETHWSAVSHSLRDAVNVLGLTDALELPAAERAPACNTQATVMETSI